MTRTRSYRNGSLVKENFPVAEVSDHLDDGDNGDGVVWIGLDGPTEAELMAVGEELGLHSLAIEDAVQRNQRAKLDHYDGHLFLSVYSARLDGVELRTAELAAFVTDRAVVTVHWPDGIEPGELAERFDDGLPVDGVGVLVHAVLDLVADSHLDAVHAMDEQLDAMEERLFDDTHSARVRGELARQAARLRRSLSQLRRVALPMRDIAAGVLRHESSMVDNRLRPYFHDVLDHAAHTESWLDSLRELAATIKETELAVQGNRLNVVMKQVTGWAAIIAVPTAITGFYGQNLPYPGFEQTWGFWFSSAVIVLSSVGLYAFFKARDWL
jgi:magnesium transporter